jgi:predicted metalloprotease
MRTTARLAGPLYVALALLLPLGFLASEGGASATTPQLSCASMEGCYAYADMEEFLDVAVDLVERFVDHTYDYRLIPDDVRYVPHGGYGREACSTSNGNDGRFSAWSFEFCPADGIIYIGQDFLWKIYSNIGDAAAVLALAHEFGHLVQDTMGVPSPRTPEESVNHENQADCFAGAWFGFAEREGRVEHPDDLRDVEALVGFIASAESDPERDHGTADERTRSIRLGVASGLLACNRYAPGDPLVSRSDRARWASLRRDVTHSLELHSRPGAPASRRSPASAPGRLRFIGVSEWSSQVLDLTADVLSAIRILQPEEQVDCGGRTRLRRPGGRPSD